MKMDLLCFCADIYQDILTLLAVLGHDSSGRTTGHFLLESHSAAYLIGAFMLLTFSYLSLQMASMYG